MVQVIVGGGDPPGNYEAKFDSFVNAARAGEKARYIQTSDRGPFVKYVLRSNDGVVLKTGRIPWDLDDYVCRNFLGVFGVPARVLKPKIVGVPAAKLFPSLEKTLHTADAVALVWVTDDGWVKGLKPAGGTYIAKFVRFSTVDKETKAPIYTPIDTVGRNKDGSTYPIHENRFTAVFEVASGVNEGAGLSIPCDYQLERKGDDEPGERWKASIHGVKGKAFATLFELAGIEFGKFDPDKCPDPDNVLGVLEPLLKESKRLAVIEMKDNGWPKNVSLAPRMDVPDFTLDDDEPPSRFVNALKKEINKFSGRDIFSPAGGFLVPRDKAMAFLRAKGFPAGDIDKYTDEEVRAALLVMGLEDKAKKVK